MVGHKEMVDLLRQQLSMVNCSYIELSYTLYRKCIQFYSSHSCMVSLFATVHLILGNDGIRSCF